eukprot:9275340-Alexandrium_andersonii.AAC.1
MRLARLRERRLEPLDFLASELGPRLALGRVRCGDVELLVRRHGLALRPRDLGLRGFGPGL